MRPELAVSVKTYFRPAVSGYVWSPSGYYKDHWCRRGTYLRRCLKLSSHEVAHTFGLKHCTEVGCRMTATVSLDHHDFTQLRFCMECEEKLKRLLKWSSRDCLRRSAALAQTLQKHEVEGEFQAEIETLEKLAGETRQKVLTKLGSEDRTPRRFVK